MSEDIKRFKVIGMHCASCAKAVENAVSQVPHVLSANVDVSFGILEIKTSNGVSKDALVRAVAKAGYGLKPLGEKDNTPSLLWRVLLSSTVAAIFLLQMAGFDIPYMNNPWVQCSLAFIVQFIAASNLYPLAFKSLAAFSPNMDFLVLMGTLSAFFLSLYFLMVDPARPLYFETSAVVIAAILLGRYIEGRLKRNTKHVLEMALTVFPPSVQLEREGRLLNLSWREIAPGDLIYVKQGEKIAADGIVIEGSSTVDAALFTGEAEPQTVGPGTAVFAGTQNLYQLIKVKATKASMDTTAYKVLVSLDQLQQSKPPLQKITDKISSIFVPLILILSIATLAYWAYHGLWLQGVINAVTVLVAACPCALGLAIPSVMMRASYKALRNGILFSDIHALEKISKINTIAFDKTGTLTEGKPKVMHVWSEPPSTEDDVIRAAASLEIYSPHILAKSLLQEVERRNLRVHPVSRWTWIPGRGIEGEGEGGKLWVGSYKMAEENGFKDIPSAKLNGTISLVGKDDLLLGGIVWQDPIRSNAKSALKKLKAKGYRLMLLTGDRRFEAERVANELCIPEWLSQMTPFDKQKYVKTLKDEGCRVLFVGDGVNDSVALAEATVGVSMGSSSPLAESASQVTLLHSRIEDLLSLFSISRVYKSKVKQNLFLAFVYNLAILPLAAMGYLNPMIAGVAMALSSLSVICNATWWRKG